MGGGYHGGFGHTFGAQAQETNLVITRPICIEADEVIVERPTGCGANESGGQKESLTPTMVTMSIVGDPHVPVTFWYGYLVDLLSNPAGNPRAWKGFTRDFHTKKGAFSKKAHTAVVNPEEYLQDISMYENRKFNYADTAVVFRGIQELLSFARSIQKAVRITVS